MIVRRDMVGDLHELLRSQMRRRQDAAVGSVAYHGEEERVLACERGELGWLSRQKNPPAEPGALRMGPLEAISGPLLGPDM
jgi:hypothetical protein